MQTYIVTAGLSAFFAFSGGWAINDWRRDSQDKAAIEKALELQKQTHDQETAEINSHNLSLIQEIEHEQRENVKLTGQLSVAQAALRSSYRPIADQIPAVIPSCNSDGSVRYDSSFVRVFNQAATAGSAR